MRKPDESNSYRWYVVQEQGGKYDDGYYGWDCRVHSDCQIHREDKMPYIPCPEYRRILVGEGASKPEIEAVCDYLNRLDAAQARAPDVAARALDQFWAAVAKQYPGINSGDLDPELVVALRRQAEAAVFAWVEANLEIGSEREEESLDLAP